MKAKNEEWYTWCVCVLIFLMMIGGILWVIKYNYNYYHKYEPIDLTSKESIIQSLKSDKELLYEAKMIMLEEMEGTEEKVITIESRGLKGYRTYHNEVLREVFQKYDLVFIQISRISTLEIGFEIGSDEREGVTYYGFYYREDGEPTIWETKELKESGDGYVQEDPGYCTRYTEPIGDGWFYYEETFYKGLVL